MSDVKSDDDVFKDGDDDEDDNDNDSHDIVTGDVTLDRQNILKESQGNRRQTGIKKKQSGTDRRKTEDTKPSNATATTRA